MVHPDNISRELVPLVDVSLNVEGVVVKAVDVGGDFNNKQEFDDRESMLTWIRRNATDLDFGAVIGRSDNGTARINAFVTMLCERSEKYHHPLWKIKRDDTSTRKCECLFKISGYMVASKKWIFSVICGLHNHDMCGKLQGHSSVCRIKMQEYTLLEDIIDEIQYRLPYGDKRKVVKLEYRSPSFDDRRNVVYSNFELKNRADVLAIWRTYEGFEQKISLEFVATVQRTVEQIFEIRKRPPDY